jgi:predicted nucleic acid-binding protein
VKVLVDTNVILDALAARKPFSKKAEQIFLLAAEQKIEGFITASGATDVYYIIRKALSAAEAHEKMRFLFSVFSILDVNGRDCSIALDSFITDFEDALLMVCGINARMDCIVTRDDDFLTAAQGNKLRVVSPDVFLRHIN